MSIEKMPELAQAVDLYFQALHECDLDKFDRVFHTSCSLFDTDDGKLTVVPIADYREVIAERVSPMSKGQRRDDALISADFLSTDIAVTKVHLRIHDKVFIRSLELGVCQRLLCDRGQAVARHIDRVRLIVFVRS